VKRLLMVAFAVALFCALPAKADVTYSYTGNTLNEGGCVGACFVSLTFTVPTAFGDSLTNDVFTPDVVSFTFSDNASPTPDTVSSTDADLYAPDTFFEVSTNSSGAITNWNMVACDAVFIFDDCIQTENEPGTISDSSAELLFGEIPIVDYYNSNDAGNAPAIVSTTPEGPGLLLLGSGLLAAGLLRSRRIARLGLVKRLL
jgi:hypothetical protein